MLIQLILNFYTRLKQSFLRDVATCWKSIKVFIKRKHCLPKQPEQPSIPALCRQCCKHFLFSSISYSHWHRIDTIDNLRQTHGMSYANQNDYTNTIFERLAVLVAPVAIDPLHLMWNKNASLFLRFIYHRLSYAICYGMPRIFPWGKVSK